MKKVLKIFSIVIISVLLLTNFTIAATDPTDINVFLTEQTSVTDDEITVLNSVLSIIQVIGISVAVIMLIVLGMKYMISSVSDRAEIKKHAIVYVVGAIMLFGASGIVQILKQFAKNVK